MSQRVAKQGKVASVSPRTRYEDDLYTWVQEQVALLRMRRFEEVDVENVVEELSDVGSERYEQLESAVRVLLMHMLKWDQQPERKTRSWEGSIEEQRDRIEKLLRKNPGLKARLREAVVDASRAARRWAAIETGLPVSNFPDDCPYEWTSMMDRPFQIEKE